MMDTTPGAPAPKKRSLFKRAAWQDAPKNEGEDMFSHANEFSNIVAERNRLKAEKRRQADAERKKGAVTGRKRRKASDGQHDGSEEPRFPGSGSGSSVRASRDREGSESRTPLSPSHAYAHKLAASPLRAVPSHPSESLAARYDPLAQSNTSHLSSRIEPLVIDLGDSDSDDAHHKIGQSSSGMDCSYRTPAQAPRHVPTKDDEELEEVLDPALAALAARARERAANMARTAAATSSTGGEAVKAPVAQLFISPEIPDSKPLMVKVRIDNTLARTRLAWCEKQGFSAEKAKDVYFTWRDTRVYDSTTIKRLGIQVDKNGNVSVDGDSNIYDDVNLPKVHVQAWTDTLFQQHKREQAAAAAAKKKAAEPQPVVEERTPTPEPAPKAKKIRLIMKAKGKEDFKLSVNPDSTFAHIADAYKQRREIDQSQPITLMFDGERLVPMDSIMDSEVEDMDSIDVFFK
ncbi:ubiquitin-2 like Rad60 SUMO-like-domain-containing protein [Ampelomyces quisqualis]|uniref:Ubiquitin-2 like Rad60 SUMO-like-domain-containing protein n=1 Tax=Ampelomyces quisqualis TaxID=50730 RepID=A0A6A5R247_AMPQU|nr:ubiquitin-2 like Rad60 SUMO-like-domain-containing protein [Ampelomyces quisqualis]